MKVEILYFNSQGNLCEIRSNIDSEDLRTTQAKKEVAKVLRQAGLRSVFYEEKEDKEYYKMIVEQVRKID